MINDHIKVLLIEDNRADAVLIEQMLAEIQNPFFELEHAERLKTGFENLFNNSYDTLLLDLNLPDSWGFDTFIRAYDQSPELPIVILSGARDEDVAIKAVREGAQDYLTKEEIDSKLLAHSISYAIERKKIEKDLMKSRNDFREIVNLHAAEIKRINEQLDMEIEKRKLLEKEVAAILGNDKLNELFNNP